MTLPLTVRKREITDSSAGYPMHAHVRIYKHMYYAHLQTQTHARTHPKVSDVPRLKQKHWVHLANTKHPCVLLQLHSMAQLALTLSIGRTRAHTQTQTDEHRCAHTQKCAHTHNARLCKQRGFEHGGVQSRTAYSPMTSKCLVSVNIGREIPSSRGVEHSPESQNGGGDIGNLNECTKHFATLQL